MLVSDVQTFDFNVVMIGRRNWLLKTPYHIEFNNMTWHSTAWFHLPFRHNICKVFVVVLYSNKQFVYFRKNEKELCNPINFFINITSKFYLQLNFISKWWKGMNHCNQCFSVQKWFTEVQCKQNLQRKDNSINITKL